MRVILARHGETAAKKRAFYGSTDIELSKFGQEQSQELLDHFNVLGATLIITTSKKRTDFTGELANKNDSEHIIIDAFREVDFGDWEGLSWHEIDKRYPKESTSWLRDPDDFTFPNGESMKAFKQRVLKAWSELEKYWDHEVIALVCHSAVISAILQSIFPNEELKYFEPAQSVELEY